MDLYTHIQLAYFIGEMMVLPNDQNHLHPLSVTSRTLTPPAFDHLLMSCRQLLLQLGQFAPWSRGRNSPKPWD
jgi:hypothetical protein